MEPIALINWVLVGVAVGVMTRLLMPQGEPLGWGAALVLAIVGSVGGGLVAVSFHLGTQVYAPAGWLLSALGATAALMTYCWVTDAAVGPR